MALAGLVLLALQVLLGLMVLLLWLRKRRPGTRFPTAIVATHIITALLSLYFWIGFVNDGQATWAWITFAILNVNNAFGDAILTGRFRSVSGTIRTWWRDYLG